MTLLARAGLLALVLIVPAPAAAQETQSFEANDGSYSFQYPVDFRLSHMFPDGTGDVTGVTASTMSNGDVLITFLGPRDPGSISQVSEQTRDVIVDEFTKAIAVLPSIRLKSTAMTTLLGQPAIDMVFTNARFSNVAINRYIFTVVEGKAYNFECIYPEDKSDRFSPACDLAVSTVRLGTADPAAVNEAGSAPVSGSCSELELNMRSVNVSTLASEIMMKDQSPDTIARMKAAIEATAAINERAGSAPSDQDCGDVDAIVETLR
ncbi:MAG: hypothetical protein WA980_19635 [Shinella zoogloeoides]|uniref:hypothetical protein n=1 Tax=Shinella zoogloeoides TaxID=352475 RepID=UPI003C771B80